ncbi:MAG: glycosyltransferase [Candidatus Margulisbacteria bacterium]|jgi:GT2 family glycosyltransferase|nr:glycosyltransferase [Candidatus Margulisiibacteriota bacterium]
MIDVIVPVFNNYELTRGCLDSVLRWTTDTPYRLIIVDDKSTDKKTRALEKNYARKHKQIILLAQKKNQGFLRAVNHGMRYSKNDVVLLNNDTLVTAGWLRKLRAAAYSRVNIASASALSNNSTITTVPGYFQHGQIPDFFTLDEMAAFVEKHSLKLYPEIPTAMGFCLYIKRAALRTVGYYDEIFDRGLCEENDWSLRARAAGWTHVMDDTTYIWHKGRGSLGKKLKTPYRDRNKKILLERYPDYDRQIKTYIRRRTNYRINRHLKWELFKQRLARLLLAFAEVLHGGRRKRN